MRLHQCPRCAWECFEKLKTHSYCINCNYFEVRKARLPRMTSMPPLPAAPAAVLELSVIDNEELITDFAHDISQKKNTA